MLCEKGVSQVFCKIHRKTSLPESLFNKVAGVRLATLLEKTLWHRSFPTNFTKYLRTFSLKNPPLTAFLMCFHLNYLLLFLRFSFLTLSMYLIAGEKIE